MHGQEAAHPGVDHVRKGVQRFVRESGNPTAAGPLRDPRQSRPDGVMHAPGGSLNSQRAQGDHDSPRLQARDVLARDIRESPDMSLDLIQVTGSLAADGQNGGIHHYRRAEPGARQGPGTDKFSQCVIGPEQPGVLVNRAVTTAQEPQRPLAGPVGQGDRIYPAGDGPGTGHQDERRPARRSEGYAGPVGIRIGGHPQRQYHTANDRERQACRQPSVYDGAGQLPGKLGEHLQGDRSEGEHQHHQRGQDAGYRD